LAGRPSRRGSADALIRPAGFSKLGLSVLPTLCRHTRRFSHANVRSEMTCISGESDDGLELERRRMLRAFLMRCRARLSPADVGLPHTARRRVLGLRRSEVAELIGVSVEWYRRLETGRPGNPSLSFLSQLCVSLRLQPSDKITLYFLALPELFQVDVELRREHERYGT
jgi:DNA-binding XRE family transcriptional regulator